MTVAGLTCAFAVALSGVVLPADEGMWRIDHLSLDTIDASTV